MHTTWRAAPNAAPLVPPLPPLRHRRRCFVGAPPSLATAAAGGKTRDARARAAATTGRESSSKAGGSSSAGSASESSGGGGGERRDATRIVERPGRGGGRGGGGRGRGRGQSRGGRGREQGRERGSSSRGASPSVAGSGSSGSKAVPPPPPPPRAGGGAWRLYGIKVPAAEDPGKDDFSAHAPLAAAVAARLQASRPLPPSSLALARKSFDARGRKSWEYVVDVDAAAARAAGASADTLIEKQGRVEWIAAGTSGAGASDTAAGDAGSGGGSGSGGGHLITPRLVSGGGGGGAKSSSGGKSGGGGRDPVIVVGAGPAGLFAALALAEAGLPVTLLDRGRAVEQRGRDIGALFARRKLDPDSNLCYGEGGAGTWSDGKLTTRIGRNSDPVRAVLRALHAFGAPESILVSGKPHMGTENLVRLLKAFRARLVELGVNVRFGARVLDLEVQNGAATGVVLGRSGGGGGADGSGGNEDEGSSRKSTETEVLRGRAVVLAPGHSARPLYRALAARGVALTPKPFAVGFRIEHRQAWLDEAQYGAKDAAGVMRGKGKIPVADYTLATTVLDALGSGSGDSAAAAADVLGCCAGADGVFVQPAAAAAAAASGRSGGGTAAKGAARGVYSFCMCPGGQIVPTSTRADELCINGMSFSKRGSPWCNSALVVAVAPADWAHLEAAHGPLAGVELQREFEREAAARGGGALTAPVQLAADFAAQTPTKPSDVPPSSYRLGVRAAPLHDLYPPPLSAALTRALAAFERKLPGFGSGARALLHGAETRTSAPLRIERRADDCCSVSLERLYVAGEGAGYAGGIVSAAVDGLRVGAAAARALAGLELPLKF